jgi:hypothetical protein
MISRKELIIKRENSKFEMKNIQIGSWQRENSKLEMRNIQIGSW